MAKISNKELPSTLAQRVRFLREQRYMTAELLALKAHIPVKQVEDIEAGIETFLAPSVRLRLARVLHIRPTQLREVEKAPSVSSETLAHVSAMQAKSLALLEAMRENPTGNYQCPNCDAAMKVRLFERRDLQDRPLDVIKAHCTRCLFRLTDD